MTDTRIPYGARCTWWDSIDKVGVRGGLPVCPHCHNVLFGLPTIEAWYAGVDRYDVDHPGYRKLIDWSRGKCFAHHWQLIEAYNKEHPDAPYKGKRQ